MTDRATKKRILIIGVAPLPHDRSRTHAAPGLRTWQFCRPLLEDGHKVCLITLGRGTPGKQFARRYPLLRRERLGSDAFLDRDALQRVHDDFSPDCVVAASSYQPTCAATRLRTDQPLWVDLPGDMMSEAQLRAVDDPRLVADYRSILEPALRQGDHFSVVSGRQRHCLVGQLGLAGRLNAATLGQDLVSVIPAGVEPPLQEPRQRPRRDRFVILSSGGYNTWTDVDVIFEALCQAMSQDPRIFFTSAGGSIGGHSEEPWQRLRRLVQSSPFKDRFDLRGWQWPGALARLYAQADLGLNVDRPCYEAELGSRNRLLDWLRHGLSCVTTPTCELARDLVRQELAFAAPPGDAEGLGRLLVRLAARSSEVHARGQRAAVAVVEQYGYAATTGPLRCWARAPRRAADGKAPPLPAADAALAEADLRRLESQLGALRGSLAFKTLQQGEKLMQLARTFLWPGNRLK